MKQFAIAIAPLLCWGILGAAESGSDPLRLDPLVEPITQSLELQLDPTADSYAGSTRIELQFHAATNEFRFHAKSIELKRATLDGRELILKPSQADLVIATAPEAYASGSHILQIDFTNTFNRTGAGLYKAVYEGRPYLFTQMEPLDAR